MLTEAPNWSFEPSPFNEVPRNVHWDESHLYTRVWPFLVPPPASNGAPTAMSAPLPERETD